MSLRNQALSVFVNDAQSRRNGSTAQVLGRLRAVHRPTRNATNVQQLENTYRLSTARALRNRLYIMCIEAISRGTTVGYDVTDQRGNTRYLEIYPRIHYIENEVLTATVPIGTLLVFVSDNMDRTRGMIFRTRIFNEIDNNNYIDPQARWARASSRRARSTRLSGISLASDLFTTDILNHIRFHPRTQRLALSMRFTPTNQPHGIIRRIV